MAVIFLADILVWSDRTNFSVAAAVWRRQLHWTPAILGALFSAFSLGYLVLQPLGGWVSDRLGPRRTLAAACGGWSVSVLLVPWAPSALWLTGFLRTLLGLFEAPFFPAATAAVARAVPERHRRGRYSGLINSGASLGPALGTMLAALIAKNLGVVWIFLLFGGAGVLLAAGWWLYAARRADPAPGDSAGTSEALERAGEPAVALGRILALPSVGALLLAYFSVPYCLVLFSTWLPVYFTQYRHFSLVQAGILSALPFLAACFGSIGAGLFSDCLARRGWTWDGLHRKLPVLLGAVTYIGAILVAAVTPAASWAAAMIVAANLGLSFITGQYWTIVSDITARRAGTVSGWMNFCGGLGALAAPLTTGYLVAATGSFTLPFRVAAAVMAGGTLLLILLVRVRPLGRLLATGGG